MQCYLPPKHLELCGERVPLQLPFVAEQLDREFTIAVYDRAQVVMWLKRARRYFPYISKQLKAAGLPDDLKYLAVAESALLHKIRSPAGAVGTWQFIPGTARRYGLRVNHWFDDRRNMQKATRAAIAYLKDLRQEFGSWSLAMAAYNCGERRLRREMEEQGVRDYYNLYLPDETMRYVFRIMAAKIILEHPERYGYHLPPDQLYRPRPADSLTLTLAAKRHLRDLARAAHTTVRRLRELNPELRTYYLPRGTHTLRVPQGQAAGLAQRLASIRPAVRPRVRRTIPVVGKRIWVVRPGESLSSIARKNGVKLADLRRVNGIRGDRLHPGQRLVIPGR